jgi:hypothetical protein
MTTRTALSVIDAMTAALGYIATSANAQPKPPPTADQEKCWYCSQGTKRLRRWARNDVRRHVKRWITRAMHGKLFRRERARL